MTTNFPHIIPIYKYAGETPLACIKRIQQAFPYYENLPMTYAGRLDPMATGLLVLLVGEECKQKEEYLALSKKYIVDIVCGISTDTHDVLGVVDQCSQSTTDWDNDIDTVLHGFLGKQIQKYPIFSSKPVDGKPLFTYAKSGIIDKITVPEHEVEIFSINIHDTYTISGDVLKSTAIERIVNMQGDFRQDECITSWKQVEIDQVSIIRLEVTAGSGTYMRQLAHDLGEKLGFPACAWSIHRTSVGTCHLLR